MKSEKDKKDEIWKIVVCVSSSRLIIYILSFLLKFLYKTLKVENSSLLKVENVNFIFSTFLNIKMYFS